MNPSREQIQAFFKHECTPRDARRIAAFLKENPHIVAEFLPLEEWYEAQPAQENEDFWEEQWVEIERRRTAKRRRVWRTFRAAAAILIFLAAGTWVFTHVLDSSDPKHSHQPSSLTKSRVITVRNGSKINQSQSLPDGSVVELSPGAKIWYQENFSPGMREIHLEGEAIFEVAKDASRPFIVFSGNINTTALGTRFEISYLLDVEDIGVHLFEGKILVQCVQDGKLQQAFLTAGETLMYSARAGGLRIGSDALAVVEKAAPESKKGETSQLPEAAKVKRPGVETVIPLWYQFDGESLPAVFDQLAAMYGVTIRYNAKDLQNKYFIGKFEQTRSLERILESIAEASGLKVEKENDHLYVIHKTY